MQGTAPQQNTWRPIHTPADLSLLDLRKLILACAGILKLRILEKQPPMLEVLCPDDAAHADAETILQQAIADLHLRTLIALRSEAHVAAIVDNVLARAARPR
jgi:hypothetical protein